MTGQYIPDALYSQFGGSVGGPILRDKAWFFGDYQGTRQKIGTSLQQNVPTTTVRRHLLERCKCHVRSDPVWWRRYFQRSGYAARAAPCWLPCPHQTAGTGTTNNYVGSGNGNDNGDQADIRLDDQVTGPIHAFARYDYSRFSLFGEPVFGAAGGTGFGLGNTTGTDVVQNQSAAAGFDYAINSGLLTDFRFGFLNYHVSENKIDAGTSPASAIGISTDRPITLLMLLCSRTSGSLNA